jgi:hypothetical protein
VISICRFYIYENIITYKPDFCPLINFQRFNCNKLRHFLQAYTKLSFKIKKPSNFYHVLVVQSRRLLVAGVGISSCFLQSNLRASPTYALQKSSVTAKTVGVYRFLTLFQIPLLLISIKQKRIGVAPIRFRLVAGVGFASLEPPAK